MVFAITHLVRRPSYHPDISLPLLWCFTLVSGSLCLFVCCLSLFLAFFNASLNYLGSMGGNQPVATFWQVSIEFKFNKCLLQAMSLPKQRLRLRLQFWRRHFSYWQIVSVSVSGWVLACNSSFLLQSGDLRIKLIGNSKPSVIVSV